MANHWNILPYLETYKIRLQQNGIWNCTSKCIKQFVNEEEIIPPSQLSALPPRGRTPAHSPLIKQKVTKSTIGPSLRNIVERNIPETERENRTVQFRIITSFFEIKIAKSFYSLITWHGFKMTHHHK